MIDEKRAKAETPGVNHVTHFNNAGAAIIPQPVRQARCRTEMVRASIHYRTSTTAIRKKRSAG